LVHNSDHLYDCYFDPIDRGVASGKAIYRYKLSNHVIVVIN
jgi:hypothetical protein